MQDKSNSFLSKYISYFGPFMIFLGVTRLIYYYSAFNINIVQFLDFTEIITSFFDILTIIVIQVVFTTIQNFLLKSKADVAEKIAIRTQIIDEESFWKRFKKYFKYFDNFLFGGIGLSITFWIISLASKKVHATEALYILLFYAVFFLVLIAVAEIDVKHRQFNSTKEEKENHYLLIYFLLFTGMLLYATYKEISSVKEDKRYYGVSYVLDDNTKIVSDSTNYFIGKTQNFVFFYHESNNTTDVTPVNRIKSWAFTRKNSR